MFGDPHSLLYFFFFFNDTATTEIYTLSLHDALPICTASRRVGWPWPGTAPPRNHGDRKSTRLNSSHGYISYAVFCLKKKKKTTLYNIAVNDQKILISFSHLHLAGFITPPT